MVIDLVAIAIFHLGIGIAEPSKIPRSHQSHFIIYCVYIYIYIYVHVGWLTGFRNMGYDNHQSQGITTLLTTANQ
jgi:hypothetical protein